MLKALVQMDAVQAELRDLRNEVELQRRDLESLRRRQQELYGDLDRRISTQGPEANLPPRAGVTPSFETDVPRAGAGASTSAETPPTTAAEPAISEITIGATTPTAPSTDSQPASGDPAGAEAAYEAAFEFLRQSRYEDAIAGFNTLIVRYPTSELADDAQYWIAEAHYVTRNFDGALQAFRGVVSRYPESKRVPEALLKVGYVQYEVGAMEEAHATLTNVINKFPGSRVAISAETRLRKMQQEGLAPSTSVQ